MTVQSHSMLLTSFLLVPFFYLSFSFRGEKYLQQVWWMRQYSSSAVQIKSGLGFPQTQSSQCSISFRAKKGMSVCMGERGTIRSPWPSCWLGFSALQINCCSLTFKASLIELSVAYRAMLSLIALFYQHSTTGQWVVTSNHPVFCNKQISCDLCSINVQS